MMTAFAALGPTPWGTQSLGLPRPFLKSVPQTGQMTAES